MQRRLGVDSNRFLGASEHAAGAVRAEKTRGTPQQVSGCQRTCCRRDVCQRSSQTQIHMTPSLRESGTIVEEESRNTITVRGQRGQSKTVPPGYDRMAAFGNSAAGAAGLRSSLSTFWLGVGRDHEPRLLRVVDS